MTATDAAPEGGIGPAEGGNDGAAGAVPASAPMPTPSPTPTPAPIPGVAPTVVADAVVRRRRVESRQHGLTRWLAVVTVGSLLVLAALAFLGYRASLRIGGGSAERITDPEAPGYLAAPRPSTVDLFVVTNPDGSFASAMVVVPDPSGSGGTVVPLPSSLVVPEFEGAAPEGLGDLWAKGGLEAVQERLGVALSFRINSAEVVPADAVTALAGSEPITLTNPDDLVRRAEDGSETVAYRAGELTLEPEEVVDYLGFVGSDDPAPNQALRAQTVWEQLLGRAPTADLAGLSAGERTDGSESPPFGEVVESLVAGEPTLEQVPMEKVPVPGTYFIAWMPDPDNLQRFVAQVVPLPESPLPGVRVPVQIRNGTTNPDAVAAAVPVVVGAGGEVLLVGNADSFDVATTAVRWATPGAQPVAEAIAAQLGVTATALPESADLDGAVVDVVIGADRAG